MDKNSVSSSVLGEKYFPVLSLAKEGEGVNEKRMVRKIRKPKGRCMQGRAFEGRQTERTHDKIGWVVGQKARVLLKR